MKVPLFYYEAYKAIHSTENDDLKEVQKIHLATRQANRFAVFARYPQSKNNTEQTSTVVLQRCEQAQTKHKPK